MTRGEWDYPNPHVVELEVVSADIDAYEHVNNSVYLSWFDGVAWSHSASLGIPLERCIAMRRGMAAYRVQIEYLRAAKLGDRVRVGTWIVSSDRKLRVARSFQVLHALGDTTLARARTQYACINLDSGRAVRMPEAFAAAYLPTHTALPTHAA